MQKIEAYLSSRHSFTVRFGLEMLMCHFMDEDFSLQHLSRAAAVRSQDYYVNMMIAWFFATALTRHYEQTLPFIEKGALDAWVHNKAIQKARESLCISQSKKEYLRSLRR